MASRKILLVEGRDDEHVLKNLCGQRDIQHLDEIRPHEGAEDLLGALSIQLRAGSEEGDVVGVVIDADQDPAARWRSIRERLTQEGYEDVPEQPDPDGTTIEPPDESLLPRVGVWVMPNNQDCGNLEDFLQSLVPQQDSLLVHATGVVKDLPEQRFGDNDKAKAVMHTWLAWQSSPGRPYGTAISAGFLDPSMPEANRLVSWLTRLFYPL